MSLRSWHKIRRADSRPLAFILLLILFLSACNPADEKSDSSENPTIAPSQITLVPNTSSTGNTTPAQSLNVGQGTLNLNVTMPEGYKFNNAAPFTLKLTSSTDDVTLDDGWQNYQTTDPTMPLEIPLILQAGASLLNMDLTIYWCEAVKETLCFVEKQTLTIPVNITADAGQSVATIEVALIPPEIDNE